jgi:hypothetical protein
MIIAEHFETRADGVELIRTYSDKGVKIQKVGTDEVYDEAVDVEGAGYRYTETEEPIETESNEEEV